MPSQEARTRIYESDSAEWKKAYYEKNKAKLATRNKEKLICECCGRKVSRGQMTKHKDTPYCKNRTMTSTAKDAEMQSIVAELHNATLDIKNATAEMKIAQEKYDQVRANLDAYLDAQDVTKVD